jgi:hypothetical protein
MRNTGTIYEQLDDYYDPCDVLAAEHPGSSDRPLQSPDEGGRGDQVTEHLGNGLYQDHYDHQELLGTLVDRLVLIVREVQLYDLGTDEQLHDDRGGHDRADPQMHQGALGPGQYRPVRTENVDDIFLVEPIKVHVGHHEVEDQHQDDPQQLGPEVHMAFRTLYRWQSVR